MTTAEEIRSILNVNDMGDIESASTSFDRSTEDWIVHGGVASNGITYGPAESAIEWGFQGCPILPRAMRENYGKDQLPTELRGIFEEAVTFDQLDSGVLRSSSIDHLSSGHRRILRDFLYGLHIPGDMTVIPAGVPWSWLSSLPVSSRARNAVRRSFQNRSPGATLLSPLTSNQFMSLRGVGILALIDWMCVIESAESTQQGRGTQNSETGVARTVTVPINVLEEVIRNEAQQLLNRMSPLADDINRFARWALAESDVGTIGEAIELAVEIPLGEPTEWKSLAEYKLEDLVTPPSHPYCILATWAEQLSSRERAIFDERLSVDSPRRTLEALAKSFGITRERVRQVESKLGERLARFLNENEALPIHWRAETIRRAIGVAIPSGWVESILEAPPGYDDYRSIILEIAGPYHFDKGWYVDSESIQDDPTDTILEEVDEVGRIDTTLATEQLLRWGLRERFHRDWLTRNSAVRSFNGHLVRWGASVGDRMAFALEDIGRPSTIDELILHIHETTTRGSVANALGTDPRIIRVNQTHWALKSWDTPEYSGVAYSIRNVLEKNERVMSVDDLVWLMLDTYGVKESTTKAYCAAPMFVSDGDSIELRTTRHDPYQADLSSLRDTPGVFHLGTGRVGLLIEVDDNMLRGSGALFTHAAGAILGISPNANLQFSNQLGDSVRVTFPETSIVGPSLGSVRLIAERLEAQLGEYLTMILDISDSSLEVRLTNVSKYPPGWDTVGRLTGIEFPMRLTDLAQAMRCAPGEVRALLKERRDFAVLESLPITPRSKSLDEALSELETEVQRGREGQLT